MALKYGSLLLVLLLSGYSFNHFYRNKEKFSILLTSILIGASSATISFFIILATNYNLLITFILNLSLAILFSIMTSKLFNNGNGITALLTYLLGAFVGGLIGYMTFNSSKPIVIVDILFILFIYLFLFLADRKLGSNSNQKNKVGKKKVVQNSSTKKSTVILASVLLIFVIVFAANITKVKVGVIGQPQQQTAKQDDQNDLQYATIHVTPSGFNPKNTIFKPETMTKIIVNVDKDAGDNARLVSADLDINIQLKTGKNILLLNNPLKGEYQFSLEPSKSVGKLLVK